MLKSFTCKVKPPQIAVATFDRRRVATSSAAWCLSPPAGPQVFVGGGLQGGGGRRGRPRGVVRSPSPRTHLHHRPRPVHHSRRPLQQCRVMKKCRQRKSDRSGEGQLRLVALSSFRNAVLCNCRGPPCADRQLPLRLQLVPPTHVPDAAFRPPCSSGRSAAFAAAHGCSHGSLAWTLA